MAIADDPHGLTFDADSIEFRNAVQDRLSVVMREFASKRARGHGRNIITADDFRECLREAVEQVINEMLKNSR